MPRLAANLSMMFNEVPFLDRFAAARKARFDAVEFLFPYEHPASEIRKRLDGEILHPYAGRKEGESWIVELYLPFRGTYAAMAERDFISLPIATPDNLRARASHLAGA